MCLHGEAGGSGKVTVLDIAAGSASLVSAKWRCGSCKKRCRDAHSTILGYGYGGTGEVVLLGGEGVIGEGRGNVDWRRLLNVQIAREDTRRSYTCCFSRAKGTVRRMRWGGWPQAAGGGLVTQLLGSGCRLHGLEAPVGHMRSQVSPMHAQSQIHGCECNARWL